jgi:hypothetical protein
MNTYIFKLAPKDVPYVLHFHSNLFMYHVYKCMHAFDHAYSFESIHTHTHTHTRTHTHTHTYIYH